MPISEVGRGAVECFEDLSPPVCDPAEGIRQGGLLTIREERLVPLCIALDDHIERCSRLLYGSLEVSRRHHVSLVEVSEPSRGGEASPMNTAFRKGGSGQSHVHHKERGHSRPKGYSKVARMSIARTSGGRSHSPRGTAGGRPSAPRSCRRRPSGRSRPPPFPVRPAN